MLEVAFRFRHGCGVNRLSQDHPDVTIAQWCNYSLEVLEVHTPDPRTFAAMMRELADHAGHRPRQVAKTSRDGRSHTLVFACEHVRGETIDSLVERHACLYLPPLIYKGGWEHYRVIAFNERRLRDLIRELKALGTFELLRKREIEGELLSRYFLVTTDELLASLTSKQATALLAAVEEGYYEVPRQIRTEDIARRRRVPRTTFEEHVRKAESKVIQAMAPYVALYAEEPPAD